MPMTREEFDRKKEDQWARMLERQAARRSATQFNEQVDAIKQSFDFSDADLRLFARRVVKTGMGKRRRAGASIATAAAA